MNRSELESAASALLDHARAAGAEEAEVFAHAGRRLSATFEKGDLGQVQSDEGASFGLRVLTEGRLGFTATNQVAGEALRQAARDAVAIARTAPPDDANHLPDPGEIDAAALLGPRLDGALAGVGIAEVVGAAGDLNRVILERDPRLSVDRASVSSAAAANLAMSTRGVHAFDEDAAMVLGVMALARDGDETGGFDSGGAVTRSLDALPAELARVAHDVSGSCIANLGPRPARSYEGAVLFSPAAFHTAFIAPLLAALSGLAVQRGRSALAERIGERIAPGLDLVDDPTDLGAGGACAFDREGLPSVRRALVEDGVLRTFLHNSYSARAAGAANTHNAKGGPRSVPGLGAHAVTAAASPTSAPHEDLDALRRTLGTGLHVKRISGSVDPASGDFSGAAKSARWVESGEVAHSTQEVMLAGNAFDLLARGIHLTHERERVAGCHLPYALVDGLTITAG